MIAIPLVEIRNGLTAASRSANAPGATGLTDPVAVAQAWEAFGFARLHVVDYDAVAGIGSNASVLEDIIRESGLEIHANGGVQTSDGIQRLLDSGASRIVIGTRGVAEPDWLASAVESNPGALILETALRERRVVVRGWVRSLPLDIFDVLDELDGLPLGGLLVSASQSDGIRGVMELSLLEDIAEACEFPVFATGGVTTLNDLRALEHRGLAGVVLSPDLFTDALDARSVAQEFGE